MQEENREFNPLSHGETGEDSLTHLPFSGLPLYHCSLISFVTVICAELVFFKGPYVFLVTYLRSCQLQLSDTLSIAS